MQNDISTNTKLMESIGRDDLKKTALELFRLGLDEVLDSETVKELPIVGQLAKIYDIASSIRDRIFLHKLTALLSSIDSISAEQKDKFYLRMAQWDDPRIGDQILMAIDKAESVKKSQMIGKLFRHLVLDFINKEEFDKCVFAVHRLIESDFELLLLGPDDLQKIGNQVTGRIYQQELLEMPTELIINGGGSGNLNGKKYCVSPLGVKFANAVFDRCDVYRKYSGDELYNIHLAANGGKI